MIAEILPGNLWLVIKLLPLLALAAVLFGVFGWCLRRKFHAPVVSSSKPSTPDDLPARERAKKLEHALAKSEAGHKSLQLEFAALQAKSVSKQALDKVSKDLADAQHRVDADLKRIQALEAELKKSRETLNTLNSSSAEANKGQRDRTFVLENELSKTREALALLEARPDNSLALQAEVDRLRETLTNSTRVIGELRKLETTYAQALAKTQAQLDAATQASTATATDAVSLLPAMEAAERNLRQTAAVSTKIAAAKEAVERLQALNAQKEAERLAAEQAAAQAELIRLATEQAAAAAQAELAAVAAQAELAAAAAQAEQAAAVAQAEQAERDRLVAEQAAAAQAEVAVEPEPPVVEPAAIQQAELELIQPTRLPLTPTEQPQAAN
ncbi:MAG: hypothetical protein DVB25_02415 [Verrucomicrobia bacterium]|nr:MAG: hypothetical protein DVB25_02415 [Verrucomicrobiota bacterium]